MGKILQQTAQGNIYIFPENKFQCGSSVAVLSLCVGGFIFGVCFVIICSSSLLLLVPREGCGHFLSFSTYIFYSETIFMKRQSLYSGKSKNFLVNLSSAELALRVVIIIINLINIYPKYGTINALSFYYLLMF